MYVFKSIHMHNKNVVERKQNKKVYTYTYSYVCIFLCIFFIHFFPYVYMSFYNVQVFLITIRLVCSSRIYENSQVVLGQY